MLSKYEIVDILGRNKEVEKIARHFNTPNRDDLSQYIYLYMLETMDEEKLNNLYQNNNIRQFISGMIYKQIFSTHTHHYRENVKKFASINKESRDGNSYEETIPYDDSIPHELEDEVDEYLDTLSDRDRQILWMFTIPTWNRTEDIERIQREYDIPKWKYLKIVPEVKRNMEVHFGKTKPLSLKPNKGTGYNTRKVEMIDVKTGKTVKIFQNMAECKKELYAQDFIIDSIYSCIYGRQKQTKGYTFRYC